MLISSFEQVQNPDEPVRFTKLSLSQMFKHDAMSRKETAT
jgi:hypothetical protein